MNYLSPRRLSGGGGENREVILANRDSLRGLAALYGGSICVRIARELLETCSRRGHVNVLFFFGRRLVNLRTVQLSEKARRKQQCSSCLRVRKGYT